jgi:hypothetical protein
MPPVNIFEKRNITFFPCIHGSFEFALELRRAFVEKEYDAVAVEFPRTLSTQLLQAVSRLPQVSAVLYTEESGQTVYLLVEPHDPLVEAARLALESGISLYFIDRDVEGYAPRRDPYPDSYAVRRIGYRQYVEKCAAAGLFSRDEHDEERESSIAYNLQRISSRHENVLAVYGLAHHAAVLEKLDRPQPAPMERLSRDGVVLANVDPDSVKEVMSELPFVATVYELLRGTKLPAMEPAAKIVEIAPASKRGWSYPLSTDRQELYYKLADGARWFHKQNDGADCSDYQIAAMFQYMRNLSILKNSLLPEMMDIVVAARGVAGDNFAYEVWDLASAYPWQQNAPGFVNVKITPEDLRLGARRITFHRTFKTLRSRRAPFSLKRRIKEKFPGEWKNGFEPGSICSHPPEDIVIEDYGRYLRSKGIRLLSDENSRVEPFTTSILDGIDMRETIRNWHEKRIYVRETRRVHGGVGAVVIIFDPDNKPEGERFPQRITWLGEHEDESDMAFYSTTMGEKMVGPGIARCEYGGLMMTYPPLRLPDIWKDAYYDSSGARSKPEVLLWAAIEFASEKHIVYVASTPPRSFFTTLAGALGKKVIYIPAGTLSPKTLEKIRVFHILSGRDKRTVAKDYIW